MGLEWECSEISRGGRGLSCSLVNPCSVMVLGSACAGTLGSESSVRLKVPKVKCLLLPPLACLGRAVHPRSWPRYFVATVFMMLLSVFLTPY